MSKLAGIVGVIIVALVGAFFFLNQKGSVLLVLDNPNNAMKFKINSQDVNLRNMEMGIAKELKAGEVKFFISSDIYKNSETTLNIEAGKMLIVGEEKSKEKIKEIIIKSAKETSGFVAIANPEIDSSKITTLKLLAKVVIEAYKQKDFSILKAVVNKKTSAYKLKRLEKSFNRELRRATKENIDWDKVDLSKLIVGELEDVQEKGYSIDSLYIILSDNYALTIDTNIVFKDGVFSILGDDFDFDTLKSREQTMLKSCFDSNNDTFLCFETNNYTKYYNERFELKSLELDEIAKVYEKAKKQGASAKNIQAVYATMLFNASRVSIPLVTHEKAEQTLNKSRVKYAISPKNKELIKVYKLSESAIRSAVKNLLVVKYDFRCKQEGQLAPEWTCSPNISGHYSAVGSSNEFKDMSMNKNAAIATARSNLADALSIHYKTKISYVEGSKITKQWIAKNGKIYILVSIPTKEADAQLTNRTR